MDARFSEIGLQLVLGLAGVEALAWEACAPAAEGSQGRRGHTGQLARPHRAWTAAQGTLRRAEAAVSLAQFSCSSSV